MRFTIERIRTLVLASGVLLIVAIAVFLSVGKRRHSSVHTDVPKRLGMDIQQEANGVTYTQAHGGRTIFKIHASRVTELKNNHATLNDVVIELYGRASASVDRIRGAEFDYDNKTGTATAAGQVEITLEQPAPAAGQRHASKASPARNEIHLQTSGLVFNQQTGLARTAQRVRFSTNRAAGSATGASYDSSRDLLVLDHDVILTAHPAATGGGAAAPVEVHAQHAEFDRGAEICYLTGALASTAGEQVTAVQAQVLMRGDGSVAKLNATGGFTLATARGSHLESPAATMQFSERNQPVLGHLTGGVRLNSANQGRTMSGTSATMDLAFDAAGQLHHAHLEGGVAFASRDSGQSAAGAGAEPGQTERTWHSPVADVDFRQAGRGKVEPATIRGAGGVVVTSMSRRGNGAAVPSRLAASEVSGRFGPGAMLESMSGAGHARIEQTAADGTRQIATGDRLQARFVPADAGAQGSTREAAGGHGATLPEGEAQIQSAVLEGHVTLNEQPAPKPGASPPAPLLATAARAEYQSAGQQLHLTGSPRVNDGGMDLAADTVDVSQEMGEAFAHGNVKATWIEGESGYGLEGHPVSLGGRGPAHAVAAEAIFHQSSGQVDFRGHARLWQQDNSISGPLIVLDREKQTLVAQTTRAGEPVTVVMLSAPGPQPAAAGVQVAPGRGATRSAAPAVVRVRGGHLWYSNIERRAILQAAPLPVVTAQSGGVESTSNQVELFLAPPGAAASAAGTAIPAQVERMVASGHVVLSSQSRHGTGEQLVYASRTGRYELTGTAASPPRLNDPQRGSVTGTTLIFNSRNDSVSIEGHGQETMTETTAPR